MLMGIIRSLDCYGNVGLTFALWGSMFTLGGLGELLSGGIFELGLSAKDFIIVLVAVLVVYTVSALSAKGSVRERLYGRPVLSACLFGTLLIAVIMLGAYGVGYDASQFIYGDRFR